MPQKDPLDGISQALKRSGLLIQYRVARQLKETGWSVQLERAYKDDVESKVRQCDIVATKKITDRTDICLVIETKYISSGGLVFFTDKNQVTSDTSQERADSIQVSRHDIRERFSKTKKHHYFGTSAVLQQGVQINDKGEWVLSQKDILYEAINQSLKPILHYKNHSSGNTIFYPVVVIGNGKLFSCDLSAIDKESGIEKTDLVETRHCIFESSYSLEAKRQPETFIIDIVQEEYLDDFISDGMKEEVQELISYSADKDREEYYERLRRGNDDSEQDIYSVI